MGPPPDLPMSRLTSCSSATGCPPAAARPPSPAPGRSDRSHPAPRPPARPHKGSKLVSRAAPNFLDPPNFRMGTKKGQQGHQGHPRAIHINFSDGNQEGVPLLAFFFWSVLQIWRFYTSPRFGSSERQGAPQTARFGDVPLAFIA